MIAETEQEQRERALGALSGERTRKLDGLQGSVLVWARATTAQTDPPDPRRMLTVWADPGLAHDELSWELTGIESAQSQINAGVCVHVVRGMHQIVSVDLTEIADAPRTPWPTRVRVPPRQSLALQIEHISSDARRALALRLHWRIQP